MATEKAQDLKLIANARGLFDLAIDETTKDFQGVEGIETACTVSLFTDARAPSSLVPNAQKRRGFIGDLATADIQRALGGIQWVYEQARLTQDTINGIQLAIQDAFFWFVEDGLIQNFTVSVSKQDNTGLICEIVLTSPDNTVRRYTQLLRRTELT